MKTSFQRLADLRARIHQQAQHHLGVAQRCLTVAEDNRAKLDDLVVERATTGEIGIAFLELTQLAVTAADHAVTALAKQRETLTAETNRCATERRQIEKLVERDQGERQRDEERRNQRASDDWSQSTKSRR